MQFFIKNNTVYTQIKSVAVLNKKEKAKLQGYLLLKEQNKVYFSYSQLLSYIEYHNLKKKKRDLILIS